MRPNKVLTKRFTALIISVFVGVVFAPIMLLVFVAAPVTFLIVTIIVCYLWFLAYLGGKGE